MAYMESVFAAYRNWPYTIMAIPILLCSQYIFHVNSRYDVS